MEVLIGYIDKIYQNKDNINIFDIKDKDENIYKVSYEGFLPIEVEDLFYIENYEKLELLYKCLERPFIMIPCQKSNIINYFSKEKSITINKATDIYDRLKLQAFEDDTINNLSEEEIIERYLDENCSCFSFNITGISYKICKKIKNSWNKRSYRRLYLLGLTKNEIKNSLLNTFDLFKLLIKNPFAVSSISNEKAKIIANFIKLDISEEFEYCGLIYKYLLDESRKGNTSINLNIIKTEFKLYENIKIRLLNEFDLIEDLDSLYIRINYDKEVYIAKKINNLLNLNISTNIEKIDKDDILLTNEELEEKLKYKKIIYKNFNSEFTDEQKNTARKCLENNISIICGEGGTGKSHVINEIYKNLVLNNKRVILSSFTGKAVMRLNEIIHSKNCFTIDMLITAYKYQFDYIIIDEASMINSNLLYKLFKKFNFLFRIIFVGDPNQIPPIEYDPIFKNLIESNKIPTFRLTKNFRVINEKNGILENAQLLLYKENFKFFNTKDFKFINGDINYIKNLFLDIKSMNKNIKNFRCITPYNETNNKIIELYHSIFFDNKKYYKDNFGVKWYEGDIIMNINNDYENNIMNGEEGTIINILSDGIIIDYNTKQFKYFFDDSEHKTNIKLLRHSFSKTVHKSQGSEYKYVIFYIPSVSSNYNFITKNLIYTGITRAMKKIWLISDEEIYKYINKIKKNYRSNLIYRLII